MVREEAERKADQQRVFESRLRQKTVEKTPPTPPTADDLRQRHGDQSMHEFPKGESPIGRFAALLQQAMGINNLPLVSYSAMYHNLPVNWHADDWGVGQCFAIVKIGPTAHDVSFAMQHAKNANSKEKLVFRAQGSSIYFLPPDQPNLRYAAHMVDCTEGRAVLRLGFGVLKKSTWNENVAHFNGCHCINVKTSPRNGLPDLAGEEDEEVVEVVNNHYYYCDYNTINKYYFFCRSAFLRPLLLSYLAFGRP